MSMTPQAATEFHCPRWGELPEIELYMDQVILLLERALGPLGDEGEPVITSTMVNNYVKKKIVPAPEKKKYGRRQIASLIAVTILKRALSMPEIGVAISAMRDEHGAQAAYDAFAVALEDVLKTAYGDASVPLRMEGLGSYSLLDAALTAWIGKLMLRDQIALISRAGNEG